MSLTAERPLVLVGAGKMGGAMLEGWLRQGIKPESVCVLDPGPSAEMQALLKQHAVTWHEKLPNGLNAGVLLLAIKPQMMAQIAPSLAACVDDKTLVVSVAAGTPVSFFESAFGKDSAVVRVMPNTPAQVSRGISGGFANAKVSAPQKALVKQLMESVGTFVWVETEEQIDFVTAISGSGPAYVFHMAEALTTAGERLGLAPEVAAQLARQTVCGAGELLYQSSLEASTLRENVTSPGGTTAAALNVLMGDNGLTELMSEAAVAAAQRAKELSKQ
ncbi:pyrroline-5-carboxylate reductase [Pseudovibrio sp. SPO723]|uniref:pyrroline-5-carboxylate reductase n=1 Tax=Nesiotobacter zosterae TaxID=392721 RepID=UPI0029C510B3|nr:pyrroline-5-carboxylate reductase [Pseudovibrio sp. SPO723]MDX5593916.1 pyrroline-5-carboxylate reductase [Pseudovibrio sp. SPO723]